jgi:hypothetical protein
MYCRILGMAKLEAERKTDEKIQQNRLGEGNGDGGVEERGADPSVHSTSGGSVDGGNGCSKGC